MATGGFHYYGNALKLAQEAIFGLRSDQVAGTIKAMLCTVSYVPNQDTHTSRADVTNEVSGTNYPAGGFTLDSGAATYDAATNEARITFADEVAANVTITGARVIVVYRARGGAASADELLGYVVEDGDVSLTAGTLTIDLPAVMGKMVAL